MMRPENKNQIRNAGFSIIELLVATGLLLFALTSFGMTLSGLRRLEKRYEQEGRALVVLGNVLERLEAGQADDAGVQRILEAEFKASELAADKSLSAAYRTGGGKKRIEIVRTGDRLVAGIELKK